MRTVVPTLLTSLVLAAFCAPSAWAQDEGDHYDQMIRAVQDRKERSVDQVMRAPAVVQDSLRHTDLDIGMGEDPDKRKKSGPVVSPFDSGDQDDTWQLIVAGAVILLGGGFFFVTRRVSQK
jgi:LPXTG-motif cell wall-anchored protein